MDGVQDAVLVAVAEGVGTCVLCQWAAALEAQRDGGDLAIFSSIPMAHVAGAEQNGCWNCSVRAGRPCVISELRPKGPAIGFRDLLNLAEEGDAAAAQALAKQAMWIGRGLRMIIASVSPSTILIAGDLTSAWHRFGPVIEREVADLTLAGSSPVIRPSHEGEIARLQCAAPFQRSAPHDLPRRREPASLPDASDSNKVQVIKIASRSFQQARTSLWGQLCVYS
jgi:predicted NBD/HSP70 family sugar kinase